MPELPLNIEAMQQHLADILCAAGYSVHYTASEQISGTLFVTDNIKRDLPNNERGSTAYVIQLTTSALIG